MLDIDVGISDNGTMKHLRVVTGTIAPPRRRAAGTTTTATPLANIRSLNEPELVSALSTKLRAGGKGLVGDTASDGTPTVASLVAVWLISQAAAEAGRPRLVNLSKVRREDLRSVGGVARLVYQGLHSTPRVKAS